MLFKLLNVHLNNFDSNLSFLKQRITAQTQFDKQIPKKCSISQLWKNRRKKQLQILVHNNNGCFMVQYFFNWEGEHLIAIQTSWYVQY